LHGRTLRNVTRDPKFKGLLTQLLPGLEKHKKQAEPLVAKL